MNKKFDFSLIRFTPDLDRGEGFNVGIIVFDNSNIELRWSDSFKPPGGIKSNWNKDNMLKWKDYFTKEFIDDALFHQVNRTTEEYVSLISNKITSNYGIGPTRRHITSDDSISVVADYLFNKLVAKETKKRPSRATAKVQRFIKERKLNREDIFRYPIKRSLVHPLSSGAVVEFPFYNQNRILRIISAIKIKPDVNRLSEETWEQIGKINSHRMDRNGSNDEHLVILSGLKEPDYNFAQLKSVGTTPYLIDNYEQQRHLEQYLEEVCEPL